MAPKYTANWHEPDPNDETVLVELINDKDIFGARQEIVFPANFKEDAVTNYLTRGVVPPNADIIHIGSPKYPKVKINE